MSTFSLHLMNKDLHHKIYNKRRILEYLIEYRFCEIYRLEKKFYNRCLEKLK